MWKDKTRNVRKRKISGQVGGCIQIEDFKARWDFVKLTSGGARLVWTRPWYVYVVTNLAWLPPQMPDIFLLGPMHSYNVLLCVVEHLTFRLDQEYTARTWVLGQHRCSQSNVALILHLTPFTLSQPATWQSLDLDFSFVCLDLWGLLVSIRLVGVWVNVMLPHILAELFFLKEQLLVWEVGRLPTQFVLQDTPDRQFTCKQWILCHITACFSREGALGVSGGVLASACWILQACMTVIWKGQSGRSHSYSLWQSWAPSSEAGMIIQSWKRLRQNI